MCLPFYAPLAPDDFVEAIESLPVVVEDSSNLKVIANPLVGAFNPLRKNIVGGFVIFVEKVNSNRS